MLPLTPQTFNKGPRHLLDHFHTNCTSKTKPLIDNQMYKCNKKPLGCISLRKSKIGFLNLKESKNGFFVSFLNRSIQDLSDHGASKEPKNPLPEWILRFLHRTMI